MRYDPDVAPSASAWLALDEDERIAIIEQSHASEAADLPNLHLHAAIHAAVETQIALDWPNVVDAARRLQGQGLDRHDTIHAIGSVLAGQMWNMLRGDPSNGDPNAEYFAGLDQLSADSWRRDFT